VELTICERWTQRVDPPTEKWFLDYVLRSPRDSSIHLSAGWHAYRTLAELGVSGRSAFEFFGGMGAQSLMIREWFSPVYHSVMDYSPEAVEHIHAQVPWAAVWRGDAYSPGREHRSEIVGLDFGDLTVWKTREGEKHRDLLDRVFAGAPKGVVLTDVACRYLHLHRERYESLLGGGTCETYPSYLEALADRLEGLYGYVMVGGFYHRWSTVMALAPEGERGTFAPTPETDPVGLKVTA
jgi:hypothetical protein